MKIARFLWRDRVRWGVLAGDDLYTVRGNLYRNPRPGRRLCGLAEARLVAPISPSGNKVVGIAANYGERDDRDGPGLFMKQPGTVVGPLDPIVYPRSGEVIIHEAEVALVIGRPARKVSAGSALEHVFGYTCANDVSARELKASDTGRGTSMRWKQFDTFCPLGPYIVTDLDGDDLSIQCRVNGETVVEGSSGDMLWGVAELVSWVSEVMALNPGDVISTGAPGVGEIAVGDTVEVEIGSIGVLKNPVVADI